MGADPRPPVGVDVDQVARWHAEHVGVALIGPLRRALDPVVARPRRQGETGDVGGPRVVGRPSGEPVDDLAHGVVALADHRRPRARGQVPLRVVGHVGPGHDHVGAGAEGIGDHGKGRGAHARQAHLRQEVEVVLVEHDHGGTVLGEGLGEAVLAFGQHGVEQGEPVAGVAQARRHVQRGQGRVRPHLARL